MDVLKNSNNDKYLNKIEIGAKGYANHASKRNIAKDKTTRAEQVIQLLEGIEPYNIVEELSHTPVNINLAQLLGISGALCAEVNKTFKRPRKMKKRLWGTQNATIIIDGLELVNNLHTAIVQRSTRARHSCS